MGSVVSPASASTGEESSSSLATRVPEATNMDEPAQATNFVVYVSDLKTVLLANSY